MRSRAIIRICSDSVIRHIMQEGPDDETLPKKTMKLDARIDFAVSRLQRLGIRIERADGAAWIVPVEARLGRRLPGTYRRLVTRYSFPTFALGQVEFFANLGDASHDDITTAPFRDEMISQWLLTNRYFHFGREVTGSYDPICIEIDRGSYPSAPVAVWQFDHECILLENETVARKLLFESFLELLEVGANAAID